MVRPVQVTSVLIGIATACVLTPAGWVLGARVGDDRGIFGYLAGLCCIASGITAALNL